MKTLICLLLVTASLPAFARGGKLGDRASDERGDNNWTVEEQQRHHREARDERRNERRLERQAREHERDLNRKDDLDPRIKAELERERDSGDGGEDGQGERY